MKQSDFIRDFSRCLIRGSGTLFCGAGLSKMSGLPLWDELLAPIGAELGLPNTFTDLPLLAQYFVATVPDGRERLEKMVRSSLSVRAVPNIAHSVIAAMPVERLWTTNYDNLLESAHAAIKIYSRDRELLNDRDEGQRVLYKMHGEFTAESGPEPATIIITREDYELYPRQYPRMWAQLVATFATQSILFIGFGFNDPNINHILALARTRLSGGYRSHYAILRAPEPSDARAFREHTLRTHDLEATGIHCVQIKDYSDVTEVLKDLLIHAVPPRVVICGSDESGDNDELCTLLGRALGESGIGVVSGGGRPGIVVSYAAAEQFKAMGKYDPNMIMCYYESGPIPVIVPERRLGSIKYFGEDRLKMRKEMIRQARAAVLIGGRDGTREEAELCIADHVPVIPVAASGGTAEAIWKEFESKLNQLTMGGRAVSRSDFADLRGSNMQEIVNAVLRLLRQAMFMETIA